MNDELIDRIVENLAGLLSAKLSADMDQYRAGTVVGRRLEMVVFVNNSTGAQLVCDNIEYGTDGHVDAFDVRVNL